MSRPTTPDLPPIPVAPPKRINARGGGELPILPICETDASPISLIGQGTALVYVSAPGKAHPDWAADAMANASPSLDKAFAQALRLRVSFLSGGQPFIALLWEKPDLSGFEQRWLARKAGAHIHEAISCQEVLVTAGDAPAKIEMQIVEDLVRQGTSPNKAKQEKSWKFVLQKKWDIDVAQFRGAWRYADQFRRWVNEGPDTMTSLALGARLSEFATAHDCSFVELDEAQLREEKLKLLLAVGQAALVSPPRLFIVANAAATQPGARPLALVGKGITFDTGGVNLKAHENFVNAMKNDMAGAALVANVFMALVESGYKEPLILVIPTCENLIDSRSVKPGTVVETAIGKNVFIEHTDAEGRLILADALTYLHRHYNPAKTITAATLTTASLRQFGPYTTPVHFATSSARAVLEREGDLRGDQFAFWPRSLAHAQGNLTDAGDLTNLGRLPGDAHIGCGSNVAAHFLAEFSPSPLMHFDIFCTAWNWAKDYPGAHFGATGSVFHTLLAAVPQL